MKKKKGKQNSNSLETGQSFWDPRRKGEAKETTTVKKSASSKNCGNQDSKGPKQGPEHFKVGSLRWDEMGKNGPIRGDVKKKKKAKREKKQLGAEHRRGHGQLWASVRRGEWRRRFCCKGKAQRTYSGKEKVKISMGVLRHGARKELVGKQ